MLVQSPLDRQKKTGISPRMIATPMQMLLFSLYNQGNQLSLYFRELISIQWLFAQDPYTDLYLLFIRDSD